MQYLGRIHFRRLPRGLWNYADIFEDSTYSLVLMIYLVHSFTALSTCVILRSHVIDLVTLPLFVLTKSFWVTRRSVGNPKCSGYLVG